MKIKKTLKDGKLTLAPEGRIDTSTAPQLAGEISCEDVTEIVFDFSGVDYVSSAGLRVLLSTKKQMEAQGGKMIIASANQMVLDIFDIAGFTDFFTFA